MILKNLAIMFPAEVWTVINKFIKEKINEPTAKYIEENGLYHFTPNEEVANLIKQSGYIKESNAILSYGAPSAFMFAGKPDIDAFIKNMSNSAEENPLLHPEKVFYAVKMSLKRNDLANYRIRIQDNVILHEGKCILQDEQVEIKQLVIDLINDKNGNKILGFRERTKEEIEKTTTDKLEINGNVMAIPNGKFTKNTPSEECLKAIEEEKKKIGYIFKGNLTNFAHVVQIDNEKSKEATKIIWNKFREFIDKLKQGNRTPEIAENHNVKINRLISDIEQGRIKTKRSIRDENYVNSIVEFNKQGLRQKHISQVMKTLENDRVYGYAKEKENTLDKAILPNSKIHGVDHSRRVATIACAIMQGENIVPSDKNADILMTASYLHDIGRILDSGPHAKRSARKLRKMQLSHKDGTPYSTEDRKLLYFLVEGHEGKDKNNDKLLRKYGVDDNEKARYITYLNVIKDADALDRARLSKKSRMELNPKYLRLDTSKELIDFSFELEALSRSAKDNSYMLYRPSEVEEVENSDNINKQENEFFQSLQEYRKNDINQENIDNEQNFEPKSQISYQRVSNESNPKHEENESRNPEDIDK